MTSHLNEKHAVCLRIRHPSIDSEVITAAIGVQPTHAWTVGAPRITPIGRPLPGTYPDTRWNYILSTEIGESVSETLEKILDLARGKTAFFKEIREGLGSAEIDVQLHGKVHSGNVINFRNLKTLVDSQIDLGIEVFPNWN